MWVCASTSPDLCTDVLGQESFRIHLEEPTGGPDVFVSTRRPSSETIHDAVRCNTIRHTMI